VLTDTDLAAPQVVPIREGDNVPQALLDAANNVVALSARTPPRTIESRCMSPEVALMRRPSGLRNGPLIGVKPEVTGRRRKLRFWSESYLPCFFRWHFAVFCPFGPFRGRSNWQTADDFDRYFCRRRVRSWRRARNSRVNVRGQTVRRSGRYRFQRLSTSRP